MCCQSFSQVVIILTLTLVYLDIKDIILLLVCREMAPRCKPQPNFTVRGFHFD